MNRPNADLSPRHLAAPAGEYAHYSAAVVVPAGRATVYAAGQVAVDGDGQVVGRGEVERQIEQSFANLEEVLVAAGSSLRLAVKFLTCLVDPAHVEVYRRTRARLFSDIFPAGGYPANTLLIVEGLAHPDFLVEIEAVALTTGSAEAPGGVDGVS